MAQDTRFLNALRSQNKQGPPIWLMRQAGRYMPQYRAYKERYTLLQMFHQVDLIVEITRLPIELLGVDAAILFSDILTLLDGLGMTWDFVEAKGPVIATPLTSFTSFKQKAPSEAYPHIKQAIEVLKKELKVPLIGFAGAPFTIASYLIEGGSSRDLKKTKQWLFRDPLSFHHLLEALTEALIDYLNLQIEAGVDALQLFDSWAYHLGIHEFSAFSLYYMKKIMTGLKDPSIPVILYCRGSSFFAPKLAALEPAAISLDWSGDLASIRKSLPQKVALQGNLDPMVLYGPKESIKKEAAYLLGSMKHDEGYIFNLGAGILPDTPFDHVKYLVDYVRNSA